MTQTTRLALIIGVGAAAAFALLALLARLGSYVLGTVTFALGAAVLPYGIALFVLHARLATPQLLASFLTAWAITCVVAFWSGGSEATLAYALTVPAAFVAAFASVFAFKHLAGARADSPPPAHKPGPGPAADD